ncbi:MAG: nucleotide pyrophosphatase/phosphodiesterase family protein, partial [Limisphaerales bacterium]
RQIFCVWSKFIFLMFTVNVGSAASVEPHDRILILVSIDAFRADYLEKFKPPNLTKLAKEGVHAEKLIPMFPTMTFPNHHTIVTGLRPEHHGIIHNNFYDPERKENFAFNKYKPEETFWWDGEPVWATAVKQGLKANCFFWPGTGVKMAGVLPTEFKPFEKDPSPDDCIQQVLTSLDQPAEKRPNLLLTYFHHVDSAGHHDGIESPKMVEAVKQVDDAIGQLIEGIHQRKLDDIANLIIVSDHGMKEISTNRIIALGDFVDLEKVQVDFSGALAGLRPLDGNTNALYDAFKSKEKNFRTYRSETMPTRYHFTENKCIPPIILVADDGWYLRNHSSSLNKATHGFDPELDSMAATFIASGTAFQKGVSLKPVENVHLYNLLCATLGLKPAPNDGDDRLVKEVLAK